MARSVTHHHVCAVVDTELARIHHEGPVRILDMGSGNGLLLGFLQRELARRHPHRTIEVHGFDVSDSAVQRPGYFDGALRHLQSDLPGIAWGDRLALIRRGERWPYPDASFDFVVSNQVMEHVHDTDFVFGEIQRVLTPGGVSVHLFPLRQYLYETHLKMPFVHWIRDETVMRRYIKWCNRIGIGKYRLQRRRAGGTLSLDTYARRCARYMREETHYVSLSDIRRIAGGQRLKVSFRYTGDFYRAKLRTLLGMPVRPRYAIRRNRILERITLRVYALASCITLLLEQDPERHTSL